MSRTPEYLHSLKKESVLESVINRLTDAIKAGELKPGDKLPPEIDLAESLGVARSSVREAIKILSYLGVLESKRAEGTFVCNGFSENMIDPMVYGIYLNQQSVEHLMELREMTEVGMMNLAIEHHDEKELKELEHIVDKMSAAARSKGDSVGAFFREDDRFHNKVAEMGKNPMADKINRIVRTLTRDLRVQTVSMLISQDRAEELVESHRVLLEAIRNKDAEGLTEKVRESYYEVEVLGKQNSTED